MEVLPDTLAAHELADRASEATASLSNTSYSCDLGSHTAAQDTLVSSISRLALNPINRAIPPPSSSTRLVSDAADRSQALPKTDLAATEAKQAGVEVYECGKLINVHPSSL